MAELRFPTQSRTGMRAGVDEGLKSYMLGVYNYMGLGVAVTAVLVLATFTIPALGGIARVLSFPAMLAVLALGPRSPASTFGEPPA